MLSTEQQNRLELLRQCAEDDKAQVIALLRQCREIDQAIADAQRQSRKAQEELDEYCRDLVRIGALDLPTLRKTEPEGATP